MHTRKLTCLAAALLLLLAVPAGAQVSLKAAPATIQINTTYNGTTLQVNGAVPSGSDVVLRMIGEATDLHMKQKGKALGLLWMNMNTFTFAGVPNLYLVASTASPDALGQAGENIRPEALLAKADIEPDNNEHALLAQQLIHLKQREGLYQNNAASITLGEKNDNGSQAFSAVMRIPSRLKTGAYTLEALAVRDGKVVGSARQQVMAELVSTPRFLADLAFDHGTLYGVLAVIIAVISGWIVGMVFRSKGGAH